MRNFYTFLHRLAISKQRNLAKNLRFGCIKSDIMQYNSNIQYPSTDLPIWTRNIIDLVQPPHLFHIYIKYLPQDYDKWDAYTFPIVLFPFMSINIPAALVFGVNISQSLRELLRYMLEGCLTRMPSFRKLQKCFMVDMWRSFQIRRNVGDKKYVRCIPFFLSTCSHVFSGEHKI